jgi:hypothetical protein
MKLTTSSDIGNFLASADTEAGRTVLGVPQGESNSTDTSVGSYSNGFGYGASVGYNSNGSNNGASVGYNSNGSNNGASVGYYSNGSYYGASVGYYSNGSGYGASVGYNSNGSYYGLALGNGASTASITNRIEIAPINSSFAIRARISGQSTSRNWQFTAAKTDDAPIDAPDDFGNADGTLPQGMWMVQCNAAGDALTFFYNDGGTIKSGTVAIS